MPFQIITALTVLLFSTSIIGHSQDVVFFGNWQNGPEYVFLSYYKDAAMGASGILSSQINKDDYSFQFRLREDRAAIVGLADHYFIVVPGDTVKVEVRVVSGMPEVSFIGPKSREHGFVTELYRDLKPFPAYKYSVNKTLLADYKKAAADYHNLRLTFLRKYLGDKNLTFETLAREYLMMQYYESLIYPISTGAIRKADLPPDYFEDVDFAIFKSPHLLGFREFITLADHFNRYYYAPLRSDYNNTSAILIESAKASFEGEVRNNLLLSYFTFLIEHNALNAKEQINDLYTFLVSAFQAESRRLVQIDRLKKEFDILNHQLPTSILLQEMRDTAGKTVTLGEIFSTHEVLYIDFWASWCGPCIEEMTFEKQLISGLKDKPIKFVLISFDKNETAWKKSLSKVDVPGEHYIVSEGFRSAFAEYISFNEIPRYLIFDRNGVLKNHDAPRPSQVFKDKSVLVGLLD